MLLTGDTVEELDVTKSILLLAFIEHRHTWKIAIMHNDESMQRMLLGNFQAGLHETNPGRTERAVSVRHRVKTAPLRLSISCRMRRFEYRIFTGRLQSPFIRLVIRIHSSVKRLSLRTALSRHF